MKTKKIVAKNIVDYLNMKRLSPEELGDLCESSKQQIYKIMKCETDPRTDFLDRLADAMDVSVSQLTTEDFFNKKKK